MGELIEVLYDQERWELLKRLRAEASDLMRPLSDVHIDTLVYGSLARGDVKLTSDIDIFIPEPPAPELVEANLERAGIRILEREIIQATPGYAAKGYIVTGDKRGYSIPLVRLLPSEREFYSFAGSINSRQLAKGDRVPGVDKRLKLIQPTPHGHMESSINGHEGEVARLLRVDTRIVQERMRTLMRRSAVGRTGVYLKYTLSSSEGFGEVLNELAKNRPSLRRRIKK